MATVLDIATSALQRLGVIDATETPSSADSSYALSTLNLLINLVEQLGAQVVGIGCLWRRTSVEFSRKSVFSLVSRDFPTYDPAECPLCKKGVPLNEEFGRRRHARKPSSVQEAKEVP